MRTCIALLAVALAGCHGGMMGDVKVVGGGSYGTQSGGNQDIGQTRDLIDQGGIPAAGTYTAEGLVNEHDLPMTSASPCTRLLCPQAASTTWTPIDGSGPVFLTEVGFDTDL